MKQINLGAVSAYAIAVENGFTGTVEEWLASLQGVCVTDANTRASDGHIILTLTDPRTGDTREIDAGVGESATAVQAAATATAQAGIATEAAQSVSDSAEQIATNAGDIDAINAALLDLNSVEVMAVSGTDETYNGVTFTWSGNTCHVAGTAAPSETVNGAFSNFAGSTTTIPAGITPGGTYYLDMVKTAEDAIVRVYAYYGDDTYDFVSCIESGYVTIPKTVVGVIFRVNVKAGNTVDGDITVKILNEKPNRVLAKDIADVKTALAESNAEIAENAAGLAQHAGNIAALTEDAERFGVYDIARKAGNFEDKTAYGVTYTWANGVCTVSGSTTADTPSFCNFLGGADIIPEGIVPGEELTVDAESSNENVGCRVYAIVNGTESILAAHIKSKRLIKVPANITGIRFRLQLKANSSYDGDTIRVRVLSARSNAQLHEDIERVGAEVSSLLEAATYAPSDSELAAKSGGNLYNIPLTGLADVPQYMALADGEVDEAQLADPETTYQGTGYLLCPKYLLFNFPNTSARIVVNFYTKNGKLYTPRFDVLKLIDADHRINYIGLNAIRNRVVEIPDGTYMQVAQAVAGDVHLYGWTGVHCGGEVSGTAYTMAADDTTERTLRYKTTGITIPGEAKLLWVKGYSIRYLWGIDADGAKTMIHGSASYQVCTLPRGYQYFRANIMYGYTVGYDQSGNGTYGYATLAKNLNDRVSYLCSYTGEKPVARAAQVIKNAEDFCNINWKCLVEKTSPSSADDKFQVGVRYSSVPYSSLWTEPHYLGWHITKHTFVNAANDPDSHFYAAVSRNGLSTGYGTVCSAFATLVDAWPYPVVTHSFLCDPQIAHYMTQEPLPGVVLYGGGGHTILGETKGHGEDYSQYTVYDGVNPMALRRTAISLWDSANPNSRHFSYLNEYKYACYHKSANKYGQMEHYDIVNGSITGGSARPYFGDRCVCTSITGVKINIKDTAAQTLYIQKCTYDKITGMFSKTVDAPVAIAINAKTQIDVPVSNFADGAFYGFYTDADTLMEYIEYHVVAEQKYKESGDTLIPPDGEFWYMLWWEDDTLSGETEIIPYLPAGSDYTYADYRKVFKANGAGGYIFYKGALGAYCAPMTQEE